MPSSKRRPKGEGSITVLPNGKLRVRLEIAPIDGKRQWLTATETTKRAAVAKMKEFQRIKEDKVLQVKAAEDTIHHRIEQYISHLRALGRKGSTIAGIKHSLKQMESYFNNMNVSSITSLQMDSLIQQWQIKGNLESSIGGKTNRLKNFFQWCLNNDFIKKNPLANAKLPKKKRSSKRKMLVLSQAEHARIKANLLELWKLRYAPYRKRYSLKYRAYALYCLTYETGMRVGEVAALTWDCLDIKNQTITVKASISSEEEGNLYVGTPKTDAGYRTIKISVKTTQLLCELKEFSGDWSDFIFGVHENHSFYRPASITKYFNEHVFPDAGINRKFTFHDIRHTNASNMIYKKVPIALITERLGHSDISVTYENYGHLIQDCEEANKAVIEA